MRPRRSRKRSGTVAASRRPRSKDTGLPSGGSLIDALATLVGGVARIARSAGAPLRILRLGPDQLDLVSPTQRNMMQETGLYLRDLRKVAGLTVADLGRALDLTDHSLLAAVESGTATLSFELILRLAGVLARHDPLPFIMRFARTYNPDLWNALEVWGAARLPVQVERERQFTNVYRSHDEARILSDERFDEVLAFTHAAFELALRLALDYEERSNPPRTSRSRPRPAR